MSYVRPSITLLIEVMMTFLKLLFDLYLSLYIPAPVKLTNEYAISCFLQDIGGEEKEEEWYTNIMKEICPHFLRGST